MKYRSDVFLHIKSGDMTHFLEFEMYENRTKSTFFALACLGNQNSFKNGRFFNARDMFKEGERISFGKPSHNDQDFVSDDGEMDIVKGLLIADESNQTFTLFLEGIPNKKTNNAVGRIVNGMKFLQECIRNGKRLGIIESGHILNFEKKVINSTMDLDHSLMHLKRVR